MPLEGENHNLDIVVLSWTKKKVCSKEIFGKYALLRSGVERASTAKKDISVLIGRK
jgi:hypothetical protein